MGRGCRCHYDWMTQANLMAEIDLDWVNGWVGTVSNKKEFGCMRETKTRERESERGEINNEIQ